MRKKVKNFGLRKPFAVETLARGLGRERVYNFDSYARAVKKDSANRKK